MLDEPLFAKYPDFKELPALLAKEKCNGCRKEKCVLFKTCKARGCAEEKSVDFCFECPEFPCTHTGFDQHLQKRRKAINLKMRAGRVETYYDEIKDKSRY